MPAKGQKMSAEHRAAIIAAKARSSVRQGRPAAGFVRGPQTAEHRAKHSVTVARKLQRPPDTHWLYGIMVPSELYVSIYKQVMTVHRKAGVESARDVIRKSLLAAGHHVIYVRKMSERGVEKRYYSASEFSPAG